jgi:hypothetical protein
VADKSATKIMSRNFALKNKALSMVKSASGNITKDTLVKNLKTAGSKTGPGKLILAGVVLSEAAEWAMNKFKDSKKVSDNEYEMGTDLRGAPSIRGKAKAQGKNLPRKIKVGKNKMGGGKIYASTDKKYGGGIYPRKPTNG